MGRQRKRKVAIRSPESRGLAAALALVRDPEIPSSALNPSEEGGLEVAPGEINGNTVTNQLDTTNEQGWTTITSERPSKRRKLPRENSSHYPAISLSPHSRLQSSIKISDLQGLVLYVLSDGTAPQWISVRRHSEIRKVVVLMVPGLEKEMLTGRQVEDKEPTKWPDNDLKVTEDHRGQIVAENVEQGLQGAATPVGKLELLTDGHLPIKLSEDHIQEPLKPLAGIFSHVWPVLTPGDDKYSRMHSPVHAMLLSPLPKSKDQDKSHGVKLPREARTWQNKPTRVTEFITCVDQLRENDFPIHSTHLNSDEERHLESQRRQASKDTPDGQWIETMVSNLDEGNVSEGQIEQGSLTAGRDVLAIDCEMCQTSDGELSLTRISLVNWNGDIVLDELVKPQLPIEDYLTPYSGITQAILEPVTTSLSDIQSRLLSILHPKAILVGHSLNADLAAIRLTHPFLVDTSIIYPHPRGPPLKSSLKWLAKKYLAREIQNGHGTSGHNSVEDARACLDLLKQKCEKGSLWGTSDASSESIFKRLARSSRPAKHSNGAAISPEPTGRTGAVVDWGHPEKGAGASAAVHIGCHGDGDVVDGIMTATTGSEDGKIVPIGGVDLVWARLRAVEFFQGWRNSDTYLKQNDHPADLTASGQDGTRETNARKDEDSGNEVRDLSATLSKTATQISYIYNNLPPCTVFVVYSGSGNPREMCRLQSVRQQFRAEYQTKKWDQLSVKWTDTEEQELRTSTRRAREGFALIAVK